MHALLFRKWKTRVKGRDWYDLEWYLKGGTAIHLSHFCQRALESGDWKEPEINRSQLLGLLSQKIDTVNFDNIKEDIVRFIPNAQVLDIWSAEYFSQLVKKISVV